MSAAGENFWVLWNYKADFALQIDEKIIRRGISLTCLQPGGKFPPQLPPALDPGGESRGGKFRFLRSRGGNSPPDPPTGGERRNTDAVHLTTSLLISGIIYRRTGNS